MRRRATAVPTNFFPKDNTVPYPHSSTNQQKKSTPQGRKRGNPRPGSQMAILGATLTPSAPTGRLVHEKGEAISHWCPDANKTGEYAWKCDGCGEWFFWSVNLQQWARAKENPA